MTFPQAKGMIYSAPMVLGLLARRKTMTRRLVKNVEYFSCLTGDCPHERQQQCDQEISESAPYGKIGGRIWVRETCRAEELPDMRDGVRYLADSDWRVIENTQAAADAWIDLHHYAYKVRKQKGTWVAPMHMPRWASRPELDHILTAVRIERVQDISREDAIAEGLERAPGIQSLYGISSLPITWRSDPRDAYHALWTHLHGAASWDANPLVWVLEYKMAAP